MKKLLSLLLVLCMVLSLSLTGCGSDSSGNGDSTQEENVDNKTDKKDKDKDKKEEKDSFSYKTYDDFDDFNTFYNSTTEKKMYFSYPALREDSVYGGYSINLGTHDHYIITVMQDYEEPVYNGPIDGLHETAMPNFIRALNSVVTAYDSSNPSEAVNVTTSSVILDSGIQAIKFEGTYVMWTGTIVPIYGYHFVYEDFTLSFGYVIDNEEGNTPEYNAQLKDLVDRMVLTVRMEK
ncbi:MAG: hypothetical protein J6B39_06180 [Lachnospiraceae bacterium]|nr:hypothetical protein [Lachnospiraceae bacterium]